MGKYRRVLYPSADGSEAQPNGRAKDYQLVACDEYGRPYVSLYSGTDDWGMRDLYRRILEQPKDGIDPRHLRALELAVIWEDDLPVVRDDSIKIALKSLREVSALLYAEGIWVGETQLPWLPNQVRESLERAFRQLSEHYFLNGEGRMHYRRWRRVMRRIRNLSESAMWKMFRDRFYGATMARDW
jgi:hypothetical protein